MRAVYSRQELRLGPVSRRSPRRDRRLWRTVPTGRRDAGHEPGEEPQAARAAAQAVAAAPRGLSATLWTTALGDDAAYVTRLRQVSGKPLVAGDLARASLIPRVGAPQTYSGEREAR